MTTFGLAMIAHRESAIIQRCLNSVKHLIDEYVIQVCEEDDDTISIAKTTLDGWGKKGDILVRPWVDFGTNKSHLMLEARARLKTDFIFFLDAKEVFVTRNHRPITEKVREELTFEIAKYPSIDIFFLNTHNGNTRTSRWQIVRNNQTYYWMYPIHEQLKPTRQGKSVLLETLINYVRRDGASTDGPKKYLNYAKMAIDYMKAHPDLDDDGIRHCTFYAAQSFCDASDNVQGLEWYEKYIALNANDSYTYVSMYRAAGILASQNKISEAKKLYNEAISSFPSHHRAYYDISRLHQKEGDYENGLMYASKGDSIPSSLGHKLFEDITIRNWRLKHEIAICYHKLGKNEKAIEYLNKILEGCEISDVDRENIEKYKKSLESVTAVKFLWNISPKVPTILVIDDFLKDPYEYRKFALSQEFHVKGNYPGLRTESFRTDEIKSFFEKILNARISYWPDGYNGSFQVVTEKQRTWWHRDKTDYSTLLYLSPNAPASAGTSIYVHKKLGISLETPETAKELSDDSNNHEAWELVDKIGYKFNRLVLFCGRYTHRADGYFGSCKDTGRLTQVFFYDAQPK